MLHSRVRAGLACLALVVAVGLGCAEPPETTALVGELRERSLSLAARAPGAAALDYFRQMNRAFALVVDEETAVEHRWQFSIVADRMRGFVLSSGHAGNRPLPSPDSLARATEEFEGHLARLAQHPAALDQLRYPLFAIVSEFRDGPNGA
jgi:hypothetical protein